MTLTNLDKVFWPEEGYTKGDVIAYYEAIASTILPYLKDRPMVLNRHPNGIKDKGFFQKNVSLSKFPSWIQTAKITHHERTIEYVLVQDKDTLIYIANLGCIELNPFHARVKSITHPDYLMIDLDPESVPFQKVIEAAMVVHEIFEELEVPNYCKTSGGRGLHIYVPLGAKYDYEQVQLVGKLIALLTQERLPKLISLERSPAKRQRQIYIDIPRNASGQTLAAPYSLRPRPHAPVSTPLDWKEVTTDLDPLAFDIKSVPKRIKKKKDPFKPVLGTGINVKQILARLQEGTR